MNDATLQFLLDFAEHDQPIQHLYFKRNPAICFRELLSEGYLTPTNAPDEIYTIIDGESYLVHHMIFEGKEVCWCTVEGRLVELDPMVCSYYRVDYTPFARLLMKHLRAEVTDDRKAPNRAWDLGVPEEGKGSDEVHLVRNGGTDAEVIQIMGKYSKDDTVYWFGTEPEPSSTPAQLCRLSGYLTCSNGKICHKTKLPSSLRAEEDSNVSTCANRIVRTGRHTYTYTFSDVSADPIGDLSGATYLARIIRAGAQGISLLEVISGMKISGEELSTEDIEAHGMDPELAIPVMTRKDRQLYEAVKSKLDEKIREAEENDDDYNIIKTMKTQREIVQGILNSPRSFKDGFNKLCHLVREAIKKALCDRFEKDGLGNLAAHLKGRKTIVIGVYCYYYPQKPTEWDTTHI